MNEPRRMTFSASAMALLVQEQAAEASIDQMQGKALRMALQDAGPHGRVVVQQLQDEITFTVERYAK